MIDNLEIQKEKIFKTAEHQKSIAQIFKQSQSLKSKQENLENEKCIESNENEIPYHAIPCFQESYVITKGVLVITGIEVFISGKDAQFIKQASDTELEKEIGKLAEDIGHPEYKKQIKKLIKWVAEHCYELEKDKHGSLEVYLDFVKLVRGKYEIKVGDTWYTFPKDVLRGKWKSESSLPMNLN